MVGRKSPVWHPFTQMAGQESFPQVVAARGTRLTLGDGTELLDAISSWWVITHGHCEPAIVRAIGEQANRLDQVIFAGFTHSNAEALAQILIELTPARLTRVFFSDDGSTAVEVALKMARQAWLQRGYPEKDTFLAFASAYHGDTVGAMSVGAASPFTRPFEKMMFRVVRVAHATHSQAPVPDYVRGFLEQLESGHDRLAGVIIEPLIQGAGGMIVWPEQAVRDIAQACRRLGILLIFDEVMTGFGRTGAMFAMDRLGVEPDLVCLAKGITGGSLPLAVTLATEEIYGAFLGERERTFFHGHSFTANPIACAAALANLRLMRERDMAAAWGAIETIHRERLAALHAKPLGACLTDSRICGTLAAVEIAVSAQAGYLSQLGPALYRHAIGRGILLRPLGNVLYILPPYGTSAAELHQIWDGLESCLAHVCP